MSGIEKKETVQPSREDPCAGDNWHPGKAWAAAIAATIFLLLGSMTLTMFAPVLKLILKEFALDSNYGSTLTSIHTLASAIITLPLGALMTKYGFRKLGYVAYAFMAATVLWGLMFINGATSLVVLRIIQAIPYSIAPIVGVYMITQWFPKNKQSVPIAICTSATSLATVCSQQIAKFSLSLGDWRTQFVSFGVIAIVGLVMFIFFMKPGPGFALVEAERQAKIDKKKSQNKAPMGAVLADPRMWAILVIAIAFTITQRGYTTFSNVVIIDACGVSDTTSTDITSLFNFAKMFSGVIFGLILAKCTKHRGAIIAALLTIHFLGRSVFYVMDAEWEAWMWAFVIGIVGGSASFAQMAIPIFNEGSPARIASALVIYNVVGKYVAGIAAPYVVSFVKEATGTWTAVAIPMLVIGIIGAIGAWYVGMAIDRDTKKKANLEKSEASV